MTLTQFKGFEKDLEKFFRLCRKYGITVAKIDGMEFHLGAMPSKQKRTAAVPLPVDPLAGASVAVDPLLLALQADLNSKDPAKAQAAYEKLNQMEADKIETPDELTDEQKLFYSVVDKPDSHTGEEIQ